MKNIIIKIGSLLLIALVVTTIISCKKSWIDPDINTNPSMPTNVEMSLILPSAQAGMAYAVGGDLAMVSRIWMQQMAGSGNQPYLYDIYSVTQSDINNVWNWAMYGGIMKDTKVLMEKANEQKSPHYGGIAKVMMAFSLGTMTDLFGDIPYSEAFKGDENLTPKFDSQESIYKTINTLLDEAYVDLNNPKSTKSPGSDDLIYGGDLSMWAKTARALKARYALHLAKINGNAAYQKVIDIINSGEAFTSNADDFTFTAFGSSSNEQNPNYQFWDQRYGDIVLGFFVLDTMTKISDPRISQYGDGGAGYVGAHAGKGKQEAADMIGGYLGNDNSPVPFITYTEQKFMEAEAYFKLGQPGPAATATNQAIAASLSSMGISDAAWLTANANFDATTITLEKIMVHKYIALFLNVETFTDWRRTGIPNLTPSTGSQIPRRYPYPTAERIYNSANCPNATIFDRVWWDKP